MGRAALQWPQGLAGYRLASTTDERAADVHALDQMFLLIPFFIGGLAPTRTIIPGSRMPLMPLSSHDRRFVAGD